MARLEKYVQKYTYEDYKDWDTDERFELIDGDVYLMSAPSYNHQIIVGEIYSEIRNYLKGKKGRCRVVLSPADVRLNFDTKDNTVVQPDVFVVCDKSKLDGQNCNGAPDFVLEVLSKSTSGKDKIIKFNKYLEAGVKEYWIIDPWDKHLAVHILENGRYVTKSYGLPEEDDEEKKQRNMAKVNIFEDLEIDVNDLFSEIEE